MRAYVLCAALALAACDGSKPAPKPAPAAAAPEGASPASADSAWIELAGRWAPDGKCGDPTAEWRVEPQSFHVYEMHCAVKSLAMLQNGVRATAACTVEGDDDGVDDVYAFLRQDDATLDIVQEANGARYEGLVACTEDMIP